MSDERQKNMFDAEPGAVPPVEPPAGRPVQSSFLALAVDGARPHEYTLPKGAPVQRCRSCGASIVWSTTTRGAAVPLSLATVQYRNSIAFAQSHFVDCPQAHAWGKRP